MSRIPPAQGVLDDRTVLVTDTAQANRLHNKGFVGTPESGNVLRLTLAEAAHAMEAGRLRVDGETLEDLLARGAEVGERTEVEYLAYRDLRERGLIVRPGPPPEDGAAGATGADGDANKAPAAAYRVWKRGATPKQDPWFTMHPRSERAPLRVADLDARVGDVLSIVDEDGAVTHYTLSAQHPVGDVRPGDLPPAEGRLLDDRVLVSAPEAVAAFPAAESLGTPAGERLVLSLTEAESLRRRGVLQVPDDLADHAAARQPHFPATLPVYEALRAAGVVAKSGFRFGTHLRGYRTDPDQSHADWLFHCVLPDATLQAADLSRAVRLAHGVRKTFCVAVADDPVRFIGLEWFRP